MFCILSNHEFSGQKTVLRIRIRLDPIHFGQLDPDPGSKKSAKIMKISTKINQNHNNTIHFFKNIKLMFNGHKYLHPK